MGTSEWTVDQLKEHYDQRMDDLQRSLDQRFGDADKAVNAALQAAEKAVTKAEAAAEKRFDAANEFRGQLSDQAATFMPRSEAEIRFGNLNDRLTEDRSLLDRAGGGQSASDRAWIRVAPVVAALVGVGAIVVAVLVHG